MDKKKKVIIGIVCAVTLTYFAGFEFYKNRALPRTYINNEKVSGLTLKQMNTKLAEINKLEKIDVIANDVVQLSINPIDIDLEFFGNDELRSIATTNSYLWFTEFTHKKENNIKLINLFNHGKLKNIVENYNLQPEPINAGIKFSEETNQFEITPHVNSLSINKNDLREKIKKAISDNSSTLDITEFVIKPEILTDNQDLINAKDKANKILDIQLTYNFGSREEKEIVDKNLIKDWVTFENSQLSLNKELMREYIITLSNKYDTYGKPREFKTTKGNIKTIKRSNYGWLMNRSKSVDKLAEDILMGESKVIEPVYSYTAVSRNVDDMGNSYVEIDIQNQMVYVYEKGELKVTTPTVTGNTSIKGRATPLGIDGLTYKTRNAVLRGPGYAAPVNYWMPFNGGVGLHDANWRNTFGGDIYKSNGSHGCINLPPAIARDVYDIVFSGMPIIVH